MIVKFTILYIYWGIFTTSNFLAHLVGVTSRPVIETMAMIYGAFSFLVTYHILVKFKIIREHEYVRKEGQKND